MLANILRSPIGLLLVAGILIGFNFPLGKIAGIAGVSPIVWALLVSLGATIFLLPKLLLQKRLGLPSLKLLKYAVISGLVSFVVPNLLLFSTIPQAGAGYTGLMFALSPVFTLALALMFKMNAPADWACWALRLA